MKPLEGEALEREQKHLLGKIMRREREQLPARWQYCVMLLRIHGVLSDSEADRVRARIAKRLERADIHVRPSAPTEEQTS